MHRCVLVPVFVENKPNSTMVFDGYACADPDCLERIGPHAYPDQGFDFSGDGLVFAGSVAA